jgi:hypothetical protein
MEPSLVKVTPQQMEQTNRIGESVFQATQIDSLIENSLNSSIGDFAPYSQTRNFQRTGTADLS